MRFLFGYSIWYLKDGIYYLYSGYKYYDEKKTMSDFENRIRANQERLQHLEDELYLVRNEKSDYGFEIIDIKISLPQTDKYLTY